MPAEPPLPLLTQRRLQDGWVQPARPEGWRRRVFDLLFGSDTPAARRFDLALMGAIVLSVIVTMLDSVGSVHARWGPVLRALEWAFTLAFGVEYVLRLLVLSRPLRYARSFFGVVDLVAVLPSLVSLVLTGTEQLIGIRALRILRVFRVLKLVRYVGAAEQMQVALLRSRRKIFVFIVTMLVLITVFGSIMYLVEGPEHGFTSIPRAIYWATVTMATVGFGDLTPATGLGQLITTVMILIGYGIIAVPTGIYAAELSQSITAARLGRLCRACGTHGHPPTARYCHACGAGLDADPPPARP